MAERLPDHGELTTCEISQKCAAVARKYFKRSPHGQVLHPVAEDSKVIALFNKRGKADRRVEKVLLTVRDGVCLIRKKQVRGLI